ncbi:MAG TPA: hypothetical protein VFB80_16185 [Pirellulaceae bacterium]|nr:hypothetical protein [Pirellulaceae bacterium]
MFQRFCVSLAGAVCLTLAGCGGGSGEKFTPVTGKVTVGGAPLASGAVTFHPDGTKGNKTQHIPVGSLDAEGKYKLMSATIEGAPPGWYKVTVVAQQPIDPANPYAPPKHIINPKFSDAATSGFAVEVKEAAAPGAYDFEVTK